MPDFSFPPQRAVLPVENLSIPDSPVTDSVVAFYGADNFPPPPPKVLAP
ncbi:MAG: hypothetical protein RL748_2108 [Pseudomonadota bacterium]|jgi:hypothetical protein